MKQINIPYSIRLESINKNIYNFFFILNSNWYLNIACSSSPGCSSIISFGKYLLFGTEATDLDRRCICLDVSLGNEKISVPIVCSILTFFSSLFQNLIFYIIKKVVHFNRIKLGVIIYANFISFCYKEV